MPCSESRAAGRVIWITGLSGAGKTTLARALQARLASSLLLDGDELRYVLDSTDSHYDAAGRLKIAMTYARLAALLAGQGATVIVATISLFHEVHAWNRAHTPRYLEIFLDVPEDVRRQRDPKKLYARKQAGTLHHMAGHGVPVELPLAPHLRFDATTTLDAAVAAILNELERLFPGE